MSTIDQLDYARRTVKRHLVTTLSTAETERYSDYVDAEDDQVEDETVDPRGPDLRGAVRDIALGFDVVAGVVRAQVQIVVGARSVWFAVLLAAILAGGAAGALVAAVLR